MAKENFPYQLFTVGEKYSRNDINQRLVNSQVSQQSGVSSFADSLVLFATLEKEGRPEEIQYKDFFKIKSRFPSFNLKLKKHSVITKSDFVPKFQKGEFKFFWESQNPSGNYGSPQKPLLSKFLKGELKGYLFARIEEKTKSKSNPFLYCGSIEPESFDDKANGERPFGVKFSCNDIEPKLIKNELKKLLDWRPKDNSTIAEAEELASSCLANEKVKLKKIEDEVLWQSAFEGTDLAIKKLLERFNKYSLEPSPHIFTKLVSRNSFDIRNILNDFSFYTPEVLEIFICNFLKNSKIRSVLDPSMRNGSTLYKISKEFKTQEIFGYEVNEGLFSLAAVFNKGANLKNE